MIFLTDIIKPSDLRASTTVFHEEKAKEPLGLLQGGKFKVLLREELDQNANVTGVDFLR